MSTLYYKDYQGSVAFEDGRLVIQILHIEDSVSATCDLASEAQATFEVLVDDYIETCRAVAPTGGACRCRCRRDAQRLGHRRRAGTSASRAWAGRSRRQGPRLIAADAPTRNPLLHDLEDRPNVVRPPNIVVPYSAPAVLTETPLAGRVPSPVPPKLCKFVWRGHAAERHLPGGEADFRPLAVVVREHLVDVRQPPAHIEVGYVCRAHWLYLHPGARPPPFSLHEPGQLAKVFAPRQLLAERHASETSCPARRESIQPA